MTRVQAHQPQLHDLDVSPGVRALAGGRDVRVSWVRVPEPPPVTLAKLRPWVVEHHKTLIDAQVKLAQQTRTAERCPELPAVIGFVYPDEGPDRGETHDAWVFLVIDRHGRGALARSFSLRRSERFIRQPQLAGMAAKRVAVVGVGALGSQVADLLGKAGVGGLFLVDNDLMTAGIRVRNQLDLSDVGQSKVSATAVRALRVDPWLEPGCRQARLGQPLAGPNEAFTQQLDDEIVAELAGCDLIVNATASPVPGRYLSQIGNELGVPVIHTWVSAGAWGGRVLRQRPAASGCSLCLALAQRDGDGAVPEWQAHTDAVEVMEMGCADPSFTGPGFELTTVAAQAARLAVQTLVGADGGHPMAEYDLATLTLRTADAAEPATAYTRLPIHPECTLCNTSD